MKYFLARMKVDRREHLFMADRYEWIVQAHQVVRIYHCKTFPQCPFTVEPLGPGIAHCCNEDDFVRITETEHVLLRPVPLEKPVAKLLHPVPWYVRMLRLQYHLLGQAQRKSAASQAAPACKDEHRAFV